MRILFVEADPEVAKKLEIDLSLAGFKVYHTDDFDEAYDLVNLYNYDLMVTEAQWYRTELDGLQLIKRVRKAKLHLPILVLSKLQEILTKVEFFNAGCDDYLSKPFHRDELVVRARALIRRSKGKATDLLTFGNLTLDLRERVCKVGAVELHLTGKEYLMLEQLAVNQGRTLTKEMFLDHLYGGMDEPDLKIIDVFICKLRKKLGYAGLTWVSIDTVWGRGYRLHLEGSDDQHALAQ